MPGQMLRAAAANPGAAAADVADHGAQVAAVAVGAGQNGQDLQGGRC